MNVVDLCNTSDSNSLPSIPDIYSKYKSVDNVVQSFDGKEFTSSKDALYDKRENGYCSVSSDDDCGFNVNRNNDLCLSVQISNASSGVFSSGDALDSDRLNRDINEKEILSSDSGKGKNKIKRTLKSDSKKVENKLQRDLKKIAKEKEKMLRRISNEKKKYVKPGECMKIMSIEIGPVIANGTFASEIMECLASRNVKCILEAPSIAPDNCIGWMRMSQDLSIGEKGELVTKKEMVREPFLLLFYEMTDIAELLKLKTLNEYVHNLKESSKCQVTILLYGAQNYFKKHLSEASKSKKSKRNKNNPDVCENDLDYYLTKLLLEESVCCTRAETPVELAQIILNYTKSIAEIPFKNKRCAVDSQALFYMRGENKGCVSVDTAGNGLSQLWQKTFTKFSLVSLEKAQAICEKFPSPVSLVEEIESLLQDDAIKMIANLPVRRAGGPLAKTRRIGPELARKIYTYFTATDGSQLLI